MESIRFSLKTPCFYNQNRGIVKVIINPDESKLFAILGKIIFSDFLEKMLRIPYKEQRDSMVPVPKWAQESTSEPYKPNEKQRASIFWGPAAGIWRFQRIFTKIFRPNPRVWIFLNNLKIFQLWSWESMIFRPKEISHRPGMKWILCISLCGNQGGPAAGRPAGQPRMLPNLDFP